MDDPHIGVEHALHLVIFAAHDTKIRNLLELQDLREEVGLATGIGDREPDHLYALHIAGQPIPRVTVAR